MESPGAEATAGASMFIKSPRWLLISEATLLLVALLVVAYKAAMWIRPLSGMGQTPHNRKIDPQTQLLQYYRQYPERYIRVSKEKWQYEPLSRTALHTFTLTNSATVAYLEIEIHVDYSSDAGKVVHSRVVKIPGTLAGLGTLKIENLQVKNVPRAAVDVVLKVTAARMAGSNP